MSTSDRVIELVRQTLALGTDQAIKPTDLLFYDLDFTSMDLLDFLFRIEQEFTVEIPEGTLYRLARGELADVEFCDGGTLTKDGRAALMQLLSDTPPNLFPDNIHKQTLPKYCTVAAFIRLVDAALTDPDLFSRSAAAEA